MNVDAIILSEAAALTDNNKSLSILRTLSTMSSEGFPATLPSLYLSLMIHAHPSEHGLHPWCEPLANIVRANRRPG